MALDVAVTPEIPGMPPLLCAPAGDPVSHKKCSVSGSGPVLRGPVNRNLDYKWLHVPTPAVSCHTCCAGSHIKEGWEARSTDLNPF